MSNGLGIADEEYVSRSVGLIVCNCHSTDESFNPGEEDDDIAEE